LREMAYAWAYDLTNERTPVFWNVATLLIAKRVAGILTPSFATGA